MKLLNTIFAGTVATLAGCAPILEVKKTDLVGLEPDHQRCIQAYFEVRRKIYEILEERDLGLNNLRRDYAINPSNYLDLQNVHPQVYENEDFCWVITSPLYRNTYRVLIENPNGRHR